MGSTVLQLPLLNFIITPFILLHEKFLQFDWLRTVVFQLYLKILPIHVKIIKPLQIVKNK